jgi:putative transport protein
VTAVLHKLFDIPLPVVLGIFSGAVTNTPALGAGQQILRDLGVPFDVVDQMGMSYAMAYPFGICGILLTMWLVRLFFRVNVEKEAQQFDESSGNGHAVLQTINVRVENPNLNNMAIQDVPMLNSDKLICSRLKRDDADGAGSGDLNSNRRPPAPGRAPGGFAQRAAGYRQGSFHLAFNPRHGFES